MNFGNEVFADPERWKEFRTRLDEDGSLEGFEAQFKRFDGSLVWGSASAQFYTDTGGNILGIEGVIRDISKRKQAEAQLLATHNELKEKNAQLAELNASKDTFFSIISHDLRSPFTAILGLTGLLDEQFNRYPPETVKRYIENSTWRRNTCMPCWRIYSPGHEFNRGLWNMNREMSI